MAVPRRSAKNMHWSPKYKKSSGNLRSQYQMWTIPKNISRDLDVKDGDHCLISVTYAEHNEVITVKITSGGEFRLPVSISKKLQQHANKSPNSFVMFTLDEAISSRFSFERDVSVAIKSNREERLNRLKNAPRKPLARIVQTTIFDRNQDVVAEVLYRANGICEHCCAPAPFIRRSNKTPYLEVHHIIQLANGGEDTVDNAIALCPNCHRQAHHGNPLNTNKIQQTKMQNKSQ